MKKIPSAVLSPVCLTKLIFARLAGVLAAGLLLALGVNVASAANGTWTGGSSGSWGTALNWQGSIIPGAAPDTATFDVNSTANLTITNLAAAQWNMPNITVANPSGPVTLYETGNYVNNMFNIDLSAATQDLTITNALQAATISAAGNCSFNVASGRTLTLYETEIQCGNNANRTNTITGAGTINMYVGNYDIGRYVNGTSTECLNFSVATLTGKNRAGTGQMNIRPWYGTNTINVNSGLVDIGIIQIPTTGGTITNAVERVNLNGGTLKMNYFNVTANNGTSYVNCSNYLAFNGGTLQARAAQTIIPSAFSEVRIDAGGGTIDNGNVGEVIVAKGMNGVGKLTSTGAGLLTLSAVNTYTGGTLVSAGKLQLGASASVAGDITNNATLQLNTLVAFNNNIYGTGAIEKTASGDLLLQNGVTADTQTWSMGGGGRVFFYKQVNLGNRNITITGTGALDRYGDAGGASSLANAITQQSGGQIANRAAGVTLTVANLTLPASGVAVYHVEDQPSYPLDLNGPALTLTNNLTILVGRSGFAVPVGQVTLRHAISGAYGLTIACQNPSNGVVTLYGTNTYTGGTTVSNLAKLELAWTASVVGPITNNSVLYLNPVIGGVFFTNNIYGTGSILKTVSGDLVLGQNMVTADTQTWSLGSGGVALGRVFFYNQGNLGTGNITITGTGWLAKNANAGFSMANAVTLQKGGIISVRNVGGPLTIPNLTLPAAGNTFFNYDDAATTNLVLNGPALTLTNDINFQIGTLAANAVIGDVTVGHAIGGGGFGVTKTFPGRLLLTNASTYTGATTVSGGTLLVNGSLASGSTVTVNTNATLGGSGLISGPVIVAAGGTLRPGQGGTDTTALTVNNNVSLSGTNVIAINRASAPNSGRLVVTGTLTQGGSLTVTNVGAAPQAGDTFTLFTLYAAPGGSFSGYTLPSLGAGLNWWQETQNATNVVLLVNAAPTNSPIVMGALSGTPSTVQIIGGKHAPTGDVGETLTVTSVASVNGTASTDGTSISYTPNGNYTGTNTFNYVVGDGRGGFATNTVTAVVTPNGEGYNLISATNIAGQLVLQYAGIPLGDYALDLTHDLAQPITWESIFTNTASANGLVNFTNTPGVGPDFYRTHSVP